MYKCSKDDNNNNDDDYDYDDDDGDFSSLRLLQG